MRILLCGGRGLIGSAVAAALRRHGHEVLTPSLEYSRLLTPQSWSGHLAGCQAVINAAGIFHETRRGSFATVHQQAPCALFDACVAAGIRRVVQVSALGASVDAATAFWRSKAQADVWLRSLPLDFVIVRPSLVVAAEGASSAALLRLAAWPLHPGWPEPEPQVQPVLLEDLVELLLRATTGPLPECRDIAAVGPAPLSWSDWLQQLRASLGKAPATRLPLPWGWQRVAARLGDLLHHPLLNTPALLMLRAGSVADPAAITGVLGRPPQALAQAPLAVASLRRRWQIDSSRQLAQWALAIIWLGTAYVSAWIYPHADSLQLIAATGIPAAFSTLALYAGCLLDALLGVLTLLRPARRLWWLQLAVVGGYSAILSYSAPEYWQHPFGPLLKNIAVLALLGILLKFEQAQRR